MRRVLDTFGGTIEALFTIFFFALLFPGATDPVVVAIVSGAMMFGIASRGDVSEWIRKWVITALIYVSLAKWLILEPLIRRVMNAIAWVAGRLAGHAYGLGKRFA